MNQYFHLIEAVAYGKMNMTGNILNKIIK